MALTDPAHTSAELPPLSASIGISVYPEDGTDAQSLIRRADTAMYRAKKNGRNRFEFYDTQMDSMTELTGSISFSSIRRRFAARSTAVPPMENDTAIEWGWPQDSDRYVR